MSLSVLPMSRPSFIIAVVRLMASSSCIRLELNFFNCFIVAVYDAPVIITAKYPSKWCSSGRNGSESSPAGHPSR